MFSLFTCLILAAFGSPVFESADPSLVDSANQAWRAGIACTGWEPRTHPVVPIRLSYVEGGYSSGAWLDGKGLKQIDLGPELPRRDLLHELAHAWSQGGHPALTEGRADLLADCMVANQPGLAPLDPDTGRNLHNMPNLKKWDNRAGATHNGLETTEKADAYLGAARLFRVLAIVLNPEDLWPEDGILRWKQLERKLEGIGPAGATILAVLDGGADRQRAALSDEDRDSMPWLAEVLKGTNPTRWDSDGDGWWDGAARPTVTAIPLPFDTTPVCSGFASGPNGAIVHVVYQGEWRNASIAQVRVIAGDVMILDDPSHGVWVPPGRPILLGLGNDQPVASGGTWAMVGGQGLILDWNCRSNPDYTIWLKDPVFAPHLDLYEAALREHLSRASGMLGKTERRLMVVLGTDELSVDGRIVNVSTGLLQWSISENRVDAVAALTVGLHRVWGAPRDKRRWHTAEAITRAILDDPPDTLFVATDEAAIRTKSLEATTCPNGWTGLLSGACEEKAAH